MIAVDSSVAVAIVLDNHEMHESVIEWLSDRETALAGHALAETYSVLTRLPRPVRAEPLDVARVLRTQFATPLLLSGDTAARLPDVLAELGMSGGAVHDALVALTALEHHCALATLDRRAGDTYRALGVDLLQVG